MLVFALPGASIKEKDESRKNSNIRDLSLMVKQKDTSFFH